MALTFPELLEKLRNNELIFRAKKKEPTLEELEEKLKKSKLGSLLLFAIKKN